jgi:hypothetical protein
MQLCLIRWALLVVIGVYGLLLCIVTHALITGSLFFWGATGLMIRLRSTEQEVTGLATSLGP